MEGLCVAEHLAPSTRGPAGLVGAASALVGTQVESGRRSVGLFVGVENVRDLTAGVREAFR